MGMKRLLLIAAAVVLVLFAGCGRRGAETAGGNEGTVELTYWPAPNPQEIELADTLVRLWNSLHPGIHVRMQPIPVSQSTEEVLLAAIAGKTTPDVCSNINPGALYEFTQAGGILPLDQFSDFDSVASGRTPRELLETFRTMGHFYQIPWKTNPVMMFYNIRLFSEAGITTPPRTYSEYYAAGEKVTRDIDGDGQTDVWMGERDIRPIWWQRMFDVFPFYIAASGGKTFFEDGHVAFANQYAEEVFRFFETCYARRYFPRTFFQGGDPFLLEKKATHFAGPWQVATTLHLAPSLRFDVAPIPVPDGHQGPVYTFGDFKNMAIFSTTRHPREAWEFVKFLLTAEHDGLLLSITNQVPVRGDLLTNPVFAEYFRQNPIMVKFAQQAVYTRGMDSAPDMKEIFDAISQQYERCAVYGKEAPAEAVAAAARQTKTIIEWNK
jgi:multiple sugar transport system substrate-binding protein